MQNKNYTISHGLIYNNNKQIDFYPVCKEFIPMIPRFICVATNNGSADEKQTAAYYQNPAVDINSHVNIGRNGKVTQSLLLSHRANYLQIGDTHQPVNIDFGGIYIIICNPGKLEITPDGYKSWWGKIYDDSSIIEDDGYAWLPFSNEQIETLIDIVSSMTVNMKLMALREFCPTQCMNEDVWYKMGTKGIKRSDYYTT
jgi:hypothetical protein